MKKILAISALLFTTFNGQAMEKHDAFELLDGGQNFKLNVINTIENYEGYGTLPSYEGRVEPKVDDFFDEFHEGHPELTTEV